MAEAPLHIGLLGTEFFAADLGGFGGFGFAARRFVAVTGIDPERVRITMILPVPDGNGALDRMVDGIRVVRASRDLATDVRLFRSLGCDLLVAIDWSPRFLVATLALPRTPVVLWSRDPRSDEEWRRISTLALPPAHAGLGGAGPAVERNGEVMEGGRNVRTGPTMRLLWQQSKATGRPIELAVPALGLLPEVEALYGIRPSRAWLLGTPIEPVAGDGGDRAVRAPGRPFHVGFLGRLDPIKRPWLVWALAAACPEMRFTVLGSARDSAWVPPTATPPNLEQFGHLEGVGKSKLLASIDVLVNTSIHEGLPVSEIEALANGAALAGTTDVDGVVSSFGEAVPNEDGDGLGVVAPMAAALRRLAGDPHRRAWIAEAGPAWVASCHAEPPFRAQLALLVDAVGLPAGADAVRRPAPAAPRLWGSRTPTAVRARAAVAPEAGREGARSDRRTAPRWPDFLVIGTARGGTTALHQALVDHPGVFVPAAKEPRFFAADGRRPRWAGPWDEHLVNRLGVWTQDEYLALFRDAPADVPAGEVSPLYLADPLAADRIHVANPTMRLVVVLRDPVERAHSQWRLQRQWGQETLDFPAALAAEEERLAAGWSPIYGYRTRGFYGRHLSSYLARFRRDQLHLVRFDDLVAAPASTLAEVVRFVGGDDRLAPTPTSAPRIMNRATLPRSVWLADQLRGDRTRRVLSVLGADRGAAILGAATRTNTQPSPLERGPAADLRAGYGDDLLSLEAATGFDTASWRLGAADLTTAR